MKDDFIVYPYTQPSEQEVIEKSKTFLASLKRRRSIRQFSNQNVPKEVIENILLTAGTAPSGAHKQPWKFCAIAEAELKSQIRQAAEKEEYTNYHGRMGERWLKDLEPFGTDWHKPFIEDVPWIIVVFKQLYIPGEIKKNNYYVNESVGIATGMLITAIHQAGLCTLTHTPSPMNFLHTLLERPENERAYMLLPVGYPAKGVQVPNIKRKSLHEIAEFY